MTKSNPIARLRTCDKVTSHLLEYMVFVLFIVGDVTGALCTVIGPSVFRDIRDTVLSGVRKNLEAPGHCCNKCSNSSELPQASVK